MPLDGNSTLADIRKAYADNSAYEINDSIDQALLFVQACRLLIDQTDTSTSNSNAGTETLSISTIKFNEQIKSAQEWIARKNAEQSTSRVRHASFKRFRDS